MAVFADKVVGEGCWELRGRVVTTASEVMEGPVAAAVGPEAVVEPGAMGALRAELQMGPARQGEGDGKEGREGERCRGEVGRVWQ